MARGNRPNHVRLGADRLFFWATVTSAVVLLVVVLAIGATLVSGALPALRAFGLGFLVSTSWNPVTEQFGALSLLRPSLMAVPLSIRIAFDGAAPAWLAADGDGGRSAGCDSIHHL
jgi:phosphate transport system permease protein